MPYYVFKITQPTELIKNLDFQDSFEEYKEARELARSLRKALPLDSGVTVKMQFAANQLAAEEILMEKREEKIVMEWEK
ncbi:MAG: Unknown protein [uncultured Thiotrichaceae bacterium]|uniref:Uncharacterized protein n=1 Tax=uncultured Thiotrichaceae bacterium TaxID=298394 RepID=A0A6S6TPM9_9GAMM|nr:MAG: Unknown protein [uncultured Thiotrichaceae bacterium]